MGRGTKIILHLKTDDEGADQYLAPEKLRTLLATYSDFIGFPIYLWASHEEEHEVEDKEGTVNVQHRFELKFGARSLLLILFFTDESTADEEEEEEELNVDEEEKEKKTKTVKETVWAWERVNEKLPIWTRAKDDITEEQHNAFYKALTKVLIFKTNAACL